MKNIQIKMPKLQVPEQSSLPQKDTQFADVYPFATALDDTTSIQKIKQLITEKQQLQPVMLIVIGIGGSNLGTIAVQEALLGTLYNDSNPALKIYYADTVDSDYLHSIILLAEKSLQNGKAILLNLISKSGTTTESIANFELFLDLLKKYHPTEFAKYIIITTDHESALWKLAKTEQWAVQAILTDVGGRYSVFTAVGLFPLGMLNIDIETLLQGARDMRNLCLKSDENPATQTATWLFALMQKGYTIANLFLFSNELRGCGAWWRQLVGESLGKARKLDGSPNRQAIVPIVSIGTTDLHSVGQLYFAHIAPIVTQFVVIENDRNTLSLPNDQAFEALVPHIQKTSASHIMRATIAGVQKAYTDKQLPFCTISLPEKNAYSIGQFLIYKMFETVYLADLLTLNAFDQPEVELYKKETRAILAQ